MATLPVLHDFEMTIKRGLSGAAIQSFEVENLTQPGDNYGSLLLSVRALLQQDDGTIFKKRFVAKVPPVDEKYWRFIQPERTCLAENAIYERLVPAMVTLQEAAGLPKDTHFNGFARYYGSRISLSASTKVVDHDALLVLEDLRDSNYEPGKRLRPLDIRQTQLALKYMAEFHALTVALRQKNPNAFKVKIRPFFEKFDWHAAAPDSKATMIAETLADIREATNNNQTMVKLVEKLSYEFFNFLSTPPNEDNPFNSIIHSDFWTMNLMFKYDTIGQPTHLKIIDFQTAQYDSVVHDVISFLFTSVSTSILEENFNCFLTFYYDAFIETLVRVGVNTSEHNFELFTTELKRAGYIQIPHALFMTRFILAEEASPSANELELSEVLNKPSSKRVYKKLIDILRLAQKFQILILE